jgi:hypothetical protein
MEGSSPPLLSVPNLDFPGTPVTLKQHVRPGRGTPLERLWNAHAFEIRALGQESHSHNKRPDSEAACTQSRGSDHPSGGSVSFHLVTASLPTPEPIPFPSKISLDASAT